MLGPELATVGMRSTPRGGSCIQGCRLRLRGKSGLWVVASLHYQLDLILKASPVQPWGPPEHCGVLGAEASGGILSQAPCALVGSLGVRVPFSGPGILRAAPDSEDSLTGHQPALFFMCTTLSCVILIINILFLCRS